jgi:uncharacterized protein (DUF427 family)
MSIELSSALMRHVGELRHQPVAKRIRAVVDGRTTVDTTRARLVYEPRRIVPTYAVPIDDVVGEIVPAPATPLAAADLGHRFPDVSRRPVLDPSIPFGLHSTEGESVVVRTGDRQLAGFRPADPDLADYVVLDFAAVDEWYEEDERNYGHPRDPFHRIDVLPSSRSVRLELDGVLLAESSEPLLLFETMLPVRFYLRRDDVRVELRDSDTITWCAYKGQASYLSPVVNGRVVDDLTWTYQAPLPEAERVRDRVAFFDERIDVVLDGQRRDRPVTPWSR